MAFRPVMLRPLARAMSTASPYARSLDVSSLKGRHLDDLFSFTGAELEGLLRLSHALRDKMGVKKEVYQPLVHASGRGAAVLRAAVIGASSDSRLDPHRSSLPAADRQVHVHDLPEAVHAHARVDRGGLCRTGRARALPGCVAAA